MAGLLMKQYTKGRNFTVQFDQTDVKDQFCDVQRLNHVDFVREQVLVESARL